MAARTHSLAVAIPNHHRRSHRWALAGRIGTFFVRWMVPLAAASLPLLAAWLLTGCAPKFNSSAIESPPPGLSITPEAAQAPAGIPFRFSAVDVPAPLDNGDPGLNATSVTWSSSDPAIAMVDETGLATSYAPGVVIITASDGARSASAILTVTDPIVTELRVSPKNATTVSGASQSFQAIAAMSDGTTLDATGLADWSSSNSTIATMSAGTAQTLGAGAADIVAAYGGASGTVSLTVVGAELFVVSIARVAPIQIGESAQLSLTAYFVDGTIADVTAQADWSTSDSRFATIGNDGDTKGRVLGIADGLATISATFLGMKANLLVTVGAPVLLSIGIAPEQPRAPVGGTLQLTATGTFSDGTTADITGSVVWVSSDATVATIGSDGTERGIVTGVAAGVAEMWAIQGAIGNHIAFTVDALPPDGIQVLAPGSAGLPRAFE